MYHDLTPSIIIILRASRVTEWTWRNGVNAERTRAGSATLAERLKPAI